MSSSIPIPCPACQRVIKIRDRSLFGKKVKCPHCLKSFVLTERTVTQEPVAASLPDDSRPPAPTTDKPQTAPAVPFDFAAATSSGTEALQRLQAARKRSRRQNVWLMVGFLLLAVGVMTFVLMQTEQRPLPTQAATATPTTPPVETPLLQKPYSKALLESDGRLIDEFRPTAGQSIQLFLMPSGVNLVIHLHPALLWSDAPDYPVLRASLTDDVSGWIAKQLKQVCRREPEEIDEVTIGIILGPRGSAPHTCAVVRLKKPVAISKLAQEFGDRDLPIRPSPSERHLRADDLFAYLILDTQTYAICPVVLFRELENWIDHPNDEISQGLSRILDQTDRDRLFTIVGSIADLQRHLDHLVPTASQPALTQVLDWLGDDVEIAGWSVHPEPYLHSQLLLRPVTTTQTNQLRQRLTEQLEQLPKTMWQNVALKMSPRELRFRQFIGRLPAMIEAFRQATVMQTGQRLLTLTAVLPAKAAPNLALATLFTVNEAARTNFNELSVTAAPPTSRLPESVAERMQLPVDAEFNRVPLEQALEYLCREIQVKLVLDGDALKDAGYTRNMPQTFNLGRVPMQRALFEIVKNYQGADKELVVSIDEAKKTITVLTKKYAEATGMLIFPLTAD